MFRTHLHQTMMDITMYSELEEMESRKLTTSEYSTVGETKYLSHLDASPNADLAGWNGKLNNIGMEANPGVFVYDYEIECINGQKFSGKGNVTLTR
jgi:hypothetical protein